MSATDRRSFLASMMAAAGVAASPDWLTRAMAPQDPASEWREKQLRAAVAKAKEEGKPLLVFVAPPPGDPADGFSRGQWLGAWLNHGGSQALHAVALCTVAAASLDELQHVTGAKPPEGMPLLLLVDVARVGEPDAPAPKVTAIRLELGVPRVLPAGADPEQTMALQKKRVDEGIAKLSAELQEGLNRHGAALARLATDATARLTPAQREQLTAWYAGGKAPADALLVRAAAEVRRAAGDLDDANRKRVLDGLTAAIEKEVVGKRVAGARWQRPGGCGSEFEEPTAEEKKVQGMVACGMGLVTPLCERFLNFYVAGA
jgi:hypothetical protein